MKGLKAVAILATVPLFVSACAALAPAPEPTPTPEPTPIPEPPPTEAPADIVDTTIAAGDFETLVAAVQAA